MKLCSMKLPPEKTKHKIEPAKVEAPRYPWGLRLNLETEAIEKLGLEKLPQVGTVVTVMAKAKVVEVSQTDMQNRKSRRLELQITDLGLDTGVKINAVDTLFGGEK